jgi:hypothetical protein
MYFAAADKCHLLAGDICLALGPLHSTLVHECGGMAGDHEKSAAWTTAYDRHAADIVTLAATLANALQRFGDVLDANGYNWWHSNRAKASGPEPDRPTAAEPLYDSGMALPTTAKGDNGPGLDEGALTGLLERVGRIPNGDVTKLGKAEGAWQAFAEHTTITGAADRIKGINAVFTGSGDPNVTEIETKLTTLTQAAEMLAQAAKALATPVAEHHDALKEMRDKVQADLAAAENEIIAAIVITAGIVAITAALSAGLAAPAAVGGGTVVTVEIVAGAATIIKNTVTISRLLVIFGSVVAAGTASGAFTAIPDLTTNGINTALASIAAMSVHIATDSGGEEGTDDDGGTSEQGDPNASGTQWDNVEGNKPATASISTSQARRIHILDGDGNDNSGGHAPGTGMPNKSEFPEGWEDDEIISRIEDVAKNPDQPPFLQNNGRWRVQGTRDGVEIEVIVNPDGSIWTGYPLGGIGVVQNDENGNPIN